jgi:hypothetical protein
MMASGRALTLNNAMDATAATPRCLRAHRLGTVSMVAGARNPRYLHLWSGAA